MDHFKEPDFGTKKTGMFVPDNFFADFQKEMDAKIDQYELAKKEGDAPLTTISKETPVVKMPIWKKVVMTAACACMLVAIYPVYSYLTSTDANASQVNLASGYAETSDTETFESQDQLNQEFMLTSMSDCDLYEYYCYDEL